MQLCPMKHSKPAIKIEVVGWDNAVTEFTEPWNSVPTRLAVIEDWKADGATLFSDVITIDELELLGTVI